MADKENVMEASDKDESSDREDWVVGPLGGKNTVLRFTCGALSTPPADPPARALHMTYKITQAETKLVTAILNAHGMDEVPDHITDCNLLWTGVPPKSEIYNALSRHQRINHFPRSHELTRKDRLSKNIDKYRHSKWSKLYDFVPQTFVLPLDYRELCTAYKTRRSSWIVKPIASSRGRGISIVTQLNDIPTTENVVVCRYIDNPLLVDKRKCDLRLYVAVTSYDPLVAYVYEEGLVRFATVEYQPGGKQFWNPCMHLCNYSVNKYHSDYVTSDAEDAGHKWTLSALLQHLRSRGCDTAALMQSIEEMIVKSLLSVATPIASAVDMFVPYARSCFEMYGFDILIDATLKPWLLEVNYSPSLGCDTPLDMKVKSAMLTDLFNLVGLPTVDPMLRTRPQRRGLLTHSADILRARRRSTGGVPRCGSTGSATFSKKDLAIAKATRAEYERRGGFVRVFPTQDSWRRYCCVLDPTSGLLRLSPLAMPEWPTPMSLLLHNYNLRLHQSLFARSSPASPEALRLQRYERVLANGHNSLLKSDTRRTSMSTERRQYRNELIDRLHGGQRLNQWQLRRVFAHYLGHVLRRVTAPSEVKSNQAERVMQFLQRASGYTIHSPNPKLKGKDKDAVVAKRLYDLLSLYSHETDLYVVKDDRPQFVTDQTFRSFVEVATEEDLDIVLTLSTRLHRCAHLYLGRCGPRGVKPVI